MKKPMLFLQVGQGQFEARLRIVMPNGECQTSFGKKGKFNNTCWARKSKSSREVLKRMKQYDKLCKFPKAIFCGYLD